MMLLKKLAELFGGTLPEEVLTRQSGGLKNKKQRKARAKAKRARAARKVNR